MGKHYALSDLHGCHDFLQAIQNYITDKDCVYFLGDVADRGSQGWECIKTILKDDRFYYLCGNHEDMLRKAMIEYYDDDLDTSSIDLLFYNGGGKHDCLSRAISSYDVSVAFNLRSGIVCSLQVILEAWVASCVFTL